MERSTAQSIIENTFNNPFDEGRYRNFTLNLLNEVDESKSFDYLSGQYIKDSFKGHIKKYRRIGTYTDPSGDKIDVLLVHLQNPWALERSRTMLRNFAADYLKNRDEKDAALIGYYTDNLDDWRFSYVRMEYKLEETESGRVKIREELTPARRYSYLVGLNEPNHTAQAQLIGILQDDHKNPSLQDIETAFSVDSVTKQFYKDYRGLFERLTAELDSIVELDEKIKEEFKTKSIDTANFAKKLLGQIVFLYFLQKKGWLGVGKDDHGNYLAWGMGPKDFMRRLFKKEFTDYSNFFNDILEWLFYEALASERPDDVFSQFNCKIPFLNGGLFEPLNGYNWRETDIRIDNELMADVFNTFDQYNFTVKEDEPLDKEVAVDPEMLGKVFENLLPENLRKGKGSYYTPRTIVHYMCQESLINYLDTHSDDEVTTADIQILIRKGEQSLEYEQQHLKKTSEKESYKGNYTHPVIPKSIRRHADQLGTLLAEIKVCDPAVGSGAFLVGMLNEIVKARQILGIYLKTPLISIYDLKRHCIQASLYGVDIDSGAIEIAKLRLWLSLVVDEEDYLNIHALPNLDYKIMQGNTLIEDFHGITFNAEENEDEGLFSSSQELEKLIQDLHEKQNRFFNAAHPREKDQFRQDVEDSIIEVFAYSLHEKKSAYFKALQQVKKTAANFPDSTRELFIDTELDKVRRRFGGFDHEQVENDLREMTHGSTIRHFFPWHLYFADVLLHGDGFDIVVANPPYNKERDNKELFTPVRNSSYAKYCQGKMDYWYLFLHRGIDIARSDGHICYITSRYWIQSEASSKLIKRLKSDTSVKSIVDIGKLKVFDHVVGQHMVALYQKRVMIDTSLSNYLRLEDTLAELTDGRDGNSSKWATILNQNLYTDDGYITFSPDELILRNIQPLDDFAMVSQGVIQNPDKISRKMSEKYNYPLGQGVFVLTRTELSSLDLTDEEHDFIGPFYDEFQLQRYCLFPSDKYLIYLTRDNCPDISLFPNLERHLSNYRLIMDNRRETLNGTNQYYHLHWPRKPEYFSGEKIIIPAMLRNIRAAFSDELGYFGISSNIIISRDLSRISHEVLLGILNSSLAEYWFQKHAKSRGVGMDIGVKKIRKFPIPVDLSNSDKLIHLVDEIRLKIAVDPTQELADIEKRINEEVYAMYDLTGEEINLIEMAVE